MKKEKAPRWFLPSEPGLLLVYSEAFDGDDQGESRLEVLSKKKTGENTFLSLRKSRGEDETSLETYRVTPLAAWKVLPEGEEKIWDYPIEEGRWVEQDPRVGLVQCRCTFRKVLIQIGGDRFENVLELTRSSEGGQSTQLFAPRIGLLKATYLADGTPGERILKEIRHSRS